MIYFDHNATTPLHPAALEAWLKATRDHWYNASSLYRAAAATAQRLDAARERLAELLGCDAARIVFTSGATEANNALLASWSLREGRVAISNIEHPSVREAAQRWLQGRVMELAVDSSGRITPTQIRSEASWVSIMAANNESGVLQPWEELANHCRQHGIPFHTDASQWIGKLNATALGTCDYLTGSAHKFGGPKGVGFLVLKDENEALRFMVGGPQEAKRRAGTENYPGIEAMVTALEQTTASIDTIAQEQTRLRDAFVAQMKLSIPELKIVNEYSPRLWNTVMLMMPTHDNRKWLARLSQRGFAISTGSACSSGAEGSSVVLTALGATHAELKRTLRVSGGWETGESDWKALADAFDEVRQDLDQSTRR
jgi:cysteine desulfurase